MLFIVVRVHFPWILSWSKIDLPAIFNNSPSEFWSELLEIFSGLLRILVGELGCGKLYTPEGLILFVKRCPSTGYSINTRNLACFGRGQYMLIACKEITTSSNLVG